MSLPGKHAVMEQFLAEGVKYVFGNPGSTELAFMDGLQDYPDLKYILGLHETVPMAMADGYARASHRPAVVNVHIAPGLANAMSMVYNASQTRVPLIVTAGQQDSRFVQTEPLLWADLVRFAQPWVKWAGEATRSQDIPMLLRRAFKVAAEPPQGPVMLSLPQDVMDGPVDEAITPTTYTSWSTRPDPSAVQRVARLLAEARNPLILTGDGMALSNAHVPVADLAELAGCTVMQATSRVWNFPTRHPLYLGQLGYVEGMRESLKGFDLIIAFGAGDPFMTLFYEGGTPVPDDAAFVHIDLDSWELGKNYPTDLGIVADPYWAARDILDALDRVMTPAQRSQAESRRTQVAEKVSSARAGAEEQLRQDLDKSPISPMRLVGEIRNLAPADAVYFGAGGTSGRGPFAQLMNLDRPDSFFDGNSALGGPLPGTLGVKLALPDRPVIGLLREGDSMYSIQGLWTAMKYNIAVTYVVFNNASYRILKLGMVRYLADSERKSEFLGMDFGEPEINMAKQAEVWGMKARRVEHPAELAEALRESLDYNGPSLVDVSIDGSYRHHF